MSDIESWAMKNGATRSEAWVIDTIARGVACHMKNKTDMVDSAMINGKKMTITIKWEK